MGWLAAKSLFGLPRWGLGLGVVLALGIATITINHFIDTAFDTAKESGAIEAENKGHETTLDQLGAAHEAETEIRNDAGLARFCECLLTATPDTAGNCQRYRPQQLVPGRPDDRGPSCPGR